MGICVVKRVMSIHEYVMDVRGEEVKIIQTIYYYIDINSINMYIVDMMELNNSPTLNGES